MNAICKFGAKVSGAYFKTGMVAASALVPVLSFAQATDPFDAAIAEATTKVGSYAAALVGLSAVAVVFMIAMKYVKRIPRAS